MVYYKILREADRARVEALLERHVARSLFLLSNMERGGLDDHGEPYQGLWCGAFDASSEALVGVAAHFWNDNVVMQTANLEQAEISALLEFTLEHSAKPLRGLIGPWPQLEVVLSERQIDLKACHYAEREPLYTLHTEALRWPFKPGDGLSVRLATEQDADELALWMLDSDRRVQPNSTLELARRTTRRRIEERALWVLQRDKDLALLSMTALNATVGGRIFQIGGVWTPPELRRRGHARRVVAGQIRALAERGYLQAILFTGQSNLPAQRAYEALGFERLGEYGLVLGIPTATSQP